jgi:hypothetical protein
MQLTQTAAAAAAAAAGAFNTPTLHCNVSGLVSSHRTSTFISTDLFCFLLLFLYVQACWPGLLAGLAGSVQWSTQQSQRF